VKTLVCIVRGKTIVTFDLTKNRPDDAALTAHMIGPTGNLRAPTVRVRDTLVVGYSEEAYRQLLGT